AAHVKTRCASCEDWVNFYEDDFDANISYVEWLEQALNGVEQQCCIDRGPLFEELATLLYIAKHTIKSTNYMGMVSQRKKDNQKAATYFNEAAELETDPVAKSKLYYQVATIYQTSDKAKAGIFARKAIESNSNNISSY